MGTVDYGAVIARIVRTWDNVTVMPRAHGGVEFRVENREIGHVHLNGIADLLVSVRMRRDLVASGRAQAHHTLPHSKWISFRLRTENDIPAVIQLFRANYERLRGASARPLGTPMIGRPELLGDRVADEMPS